MKDSTKIKLQKALIALGVVGGIGAAVAVAYFEGRDTGHEEGYREGFEDGKGKAGSDNKFHDGVMKSCKAHYRFIYDPFTYSDAANYVADSLQVSKKDYTYLINDESRAEAEAKLGPGFRARMVIVAKPPEYDEIPHIGPEENIPLRDAIDIPQKSIEEQPDVPTEVNENGEEVG